MFLKFQFLLLAVVYLRPLVILEINVASALLVLGILRQPALHLFIANFNLVLSPVLVLIPVVYLEHGCKDVDNSVCLINE